MKVLIVSMDLGPSKSLARLASGLINAKHEVLTSFFTVPPSKGLLGEWNPDVVITGLAAAEDKTTEIEISISAMEKKKPIIWFADTYGVFNRKKIGSLRPDLLFVPDEFEKQKAIEQGYKTVVASGIPLWEDFADLSLFPKREELRKKLGVGKNNKLILFCVISAKHDINRTVTSGVISALKELNDPDIILLLRLHPADPDPDIESCKKLLKNIAWVESPGFKATEDLLPAADFVISSISTVGIAAAYQRKRVVEYIPQPFMDLLEKLTGRRYWVPAETGATPGVYRLEDLIPAIQNLFTKEGYANLVEKQEKAYPALKGGSIRKMIDAIEKLVKK